MRYIDPNIYFNCIINKYDNSTQELIHSVEYKSIDVYEMVLNIKYYLENNGHIDRKIRLMNINNGWEWSERYYRLDTLKYRTKGDEIYLIGFEFSKDNDDKYQFAIKLE